MRLIEAGMALSSELSTDAVLLRIVEVAADLTGAKYGALGVLDNKGETLEEFITTGISDEVRAKMDHLPTGKGILGVLIRDSHLLKLHDISEDPRSAGFPPNHPRMASFLGAPVSTRGKVFGNIYLTEKIGAEEFSEDDEWTLQVLAAQAGVAIENARLYEESLRARVERQRLAVLEDRERIAKELHDGAIQSLFAVGMGLQAAAEQARAADVADRLGQSVDDIDGVIRDLRNYIFGLKPGILADRLLAEALRELADEFESGSGIVAVADVDDGVAASLASQAGDVIQLVREALSNIRKHSKAQTCRVKVFEGRAGEATVEIDDDGKGFDVNSQPPGSSNGLRNMRERAGALGGRAEIESSPDGTTVRITIPI